MKILNQQELKSIEQFFQLKQASLLKALRKYLKTKYDKVISTNDYIVAVGDIPIALTAHMDTVFDLPPHNIFYDRVKNVMWSPDGLGADDRAGVYSIIQIVKTGLRPTIILTTDEELGCLGAEKMVKDIPEAPTQLKYIIELDRRGSNDCVFYSCNNPSFDEYIESFGFVTNFGSFSDISIICPQWGVAGVNLSIGYYDEHSISETLYVGQMLSTIEKVKRMLNNSHTAEFFKYIEGSPYGRWLNKSSFSDFPREDDDEWSWDPSYGISREEWAILMEPQSKCNQCGNWDYNYNLFPIKNKEGKDIYFCSDCITQHKNVYWCSVCGEPFIDKSLPKGQVYQCKNCRGKVNGESKPK